MVSPIMATFRSTLRDLTEHNTCLAEIRYIPIVLEAYNPELKWETTKSWNYGIDLSFLENRFTFSADFYTRKTENLLATVPMPAGTNFDKLMLQNVGNVDSKGLELSVTGHIINTKNWSWTASAMLHGKK